MRQWAIVDLDGTLCDTSHRVHYAEDARRATNPVARQAAWTRFHENCTKDKPIEGVAAIVRAWYAVGHGVVYLTGRTDTYRSDTLRWLMEHRLPHTGVPLYMRQHGDYVSSAEYKTEQYLRICESLGPGNNIAFVLEDSTKLVKMWRQIGMLCLQVGETMS
jgi:beta-phosphoglucomutase-like phosphatase (HAD superfamily)